jgi:predicted acyl esterase
MTAAAWPPQTATRALFLGAGSRTPERSLNDGLLLESPPPADAAVATSYSYPDPRWAFGNVTFTGSGFDPLARNLTFVSEPFERDCLIAGTALLRLWLSGTGDDARVVAKLSEEVAPAKGEGPPRSVIVAKGWLRASHRAILSRDHGLLHDHSRSVPMLAGRPEELEIAFTPTAHRIAAGSRLRLDLSCTDSPITDAVFFHAMNPNDVGTDTIHHSAAMPSVLELPLIS